VCQDVRGRYLSGGTFEEITSAPVIDGFLGDDTQHKGAFFLLDNLEFPNHFDVPQPTPVAEYKPLFAFAPTDAETFFLGLGPLKNANGPDHFNNCLNNCARGWNECRQRGASLGNYYVRVLLQRSRDPN